MRNTIRKIHYSPLSTKDKRIAWHLTHEVSHIVKPNIRNNVILDIMIRKPKHVCIGMLYGDEINLLTAYNYRGIIPHMLFLDCDAVECYIIFTWGKE